RFEGNEPLHASLVVVLPANEVVAEGDVMTSARQMQRSRPTEVSAPTQDQDPHAGLLHPRTHCAFGWDGPPAPSEPALSYHAFLRAMFRAREEIAALSTDC